MASQYGEDAFILEHFNGRVGRFLDIGAGDGLTFSNTEPLLRAGWSGVMVEPALSQLRWLIENHGDNPNVEIIPGYLEPWMSDGNSGWRVIHDGRDFSTLISSQSDLIVQHSSGEHKFRKRRAASVSWNDFSDWGMPTFEFLNIDVEGMNVDVLRTAPLHNFEMVCIEIDPASKLEWIKAHLTASGLLRNTVIGGNLLAWR